MRGLRGGGEYLSSIRHSEGVSPKESSLYLNSNAGLLRSARNDRYAFTLAEVLITLGIIGVVAALTLPSLITKIQNKGYVEGLNKTYSVLQNVTDLIVSEEGPPSNWILNARIIGSHQPNKTVAQYYVDRMKVAKYCGFLQNEYRDESCVITNDNYDLKGDKATYTLGAGFLYDFTYPILLQDGSSVALKFRSNTDGGYFWGFPDITFIVDVNGKKKPNKVGRDIFFLYLNKDSSKIYPFIKEVFDNTSNNAERYIDDCKPGGTGYSCAYRVITEGKMNY